MNKNILIASAIITVVSIVIIGCLFHENKQAFQDGSPELERWDSVAFRSRCFQQQVEATQACLADVRMEGKESFAYLKDLAENGPVLCFRFYQTGCYACIETELQNLKTYCPDIKDRVMILADFEDYHALQSFKNRRKFKFSTYLLRDGILDWFAENRNEEKLPYYFVLQPNGRVSHFYLPDQIYPQYVKGFLSGINHLLKD